VVAEQTSELKWHADPPRKDAIAMEYVMLVVVTFMLAVFLFYTGLPAIPPAVVIFLFTAYAVARGIRMEKAKPRQLAVISDGFVFRYLNGSEKKVPWEDITDLTMESNATNLGKIGYVRTYQNKYGVPIPLEAYFDAVNARNLKYQR
jgi:hypothetical protein